MRAVRRDCDGDRRDCCSPGGGQTKGMTMDRKKQVFRLVLGSTAAAVAVVAMPSVAFAQEAAKAAENATFLTSNGAAR